MCFNFKSFSAFQIYVIDSADRRRMEETGVELQALLEEASITSWNILASFSKYIRTS